MGGIKTARTKRVMAIVVLTAAALVSLYLGKVYRDVSSTRLIPANAYFSSEP